MRGIGRHIGDTVSVPGRGARRALVVVVVLVLAAGVGVGGALSAPALAHALGLPVSLATDDPPAPPQPRAQLVPTRPDGPAPTPAGVARALDGRAGGLGQLSGAVVDPSTGTTLWGRDADTALVPASVTKLLTASAALLTLDPTTRLETTVVAGPTPDSIVVVGGGDPTLSSLPPGRESVFAGAAHLDDLVAQVAAARGGVAPRTVYLDLARYAGPELAPGWDSADIAGGSLAPIVPAMLDGARSDPTTLNPPRSAAPARALGEALASRLGAAGATVETGTAPPGAPVLGRVASAPMNELVRISLQNSDNVLSEALGREVARAVGEPATFAGATTAVQRVLAERGVPMEGVELADTSGLSTGNRLPVATLTGLLAPAAAPGTDDPRTAALRPLLDGLPVAGGAGTLDDRYATGSATAPGRGWVRAKTGTLTGTNSLAGMVSSVDGRVLVFALMSNGVDPATARPRLDALATALRECGCR